eukprot:2431565-Pleurochrysis_carterae.AAC.1
MACKELGLVFLFAKRRQRRRRRLRQPGHARGAHTYGPLGGPAPRCRWRSLCRPSRAHAQGEPPPWRRLAPEPPTRTSRG